MVSRIPATSLVASPIYPNSVAWSNDSNLLAVASGHLITILNPALPHGPRGLITLPPGEQPLPLGTVQTGDHLTPCLFPIRLSHGTQPYVQSISWSPPVLAHYSGCLLSVCTTKGRVKLYCFPYSKLCAEWTEVADLSKMLCDYFVKTNFNPASPKSVQEFGICENIRESDVYQSSQGFKSDRRSVKKINSEGIPVITAREYSSRSALLSSLTCTWSPVLHSFSKRSSDPINCFYIKCAILAVGGKSGHISFWRITEAHPCTSDGANVSVEATLVGLLHAHNSWVTAIGWGKHGADPSMSQLVLVTGSSDGSVNVWVGDVEGLIRSSEVNGACFSLVKELSPVTSIPISAISIAVPDIVLDKIVLAIGKGCGSLEAWICHVSSRKFVSAGICYGHDKVVTGLEWDFDGGRLYSCGQDGSVRIWALCGASLCESSFPSNSLMQGPNNAIRLSDPCFGLALSPGNLMLALVRTLDSTFLNPMYQARTQKAALEFFWIGGCKLEVSLEKHLDHNIYGILGLSDMELTSWESDVLCSLKKYENVDNELILWDILECLRSFKQSSLEFVDCVLAKLFSSWFLDFPSNLCIEKVLIHTLGSLSNINTRKLHLLNVICRQLILSEVLPDRWSGLDHECDDIDDCQNKKIFWWKKLLAKSERELNERRIAFSLKAFLHTASGPSAGYSAGTCWLPFGVAQMGQWVANNNRVVSDELKLLASEVRELRSRLSSRNEHVSNEHMVEESCGFCSTSVPFETPEYGFCQGAGVGGSNKTIHKLMRCSVSMQLCNIESSLWACMCCHRVAERLVPGAFFTMSKSSLDVGFEVSDSDLMECSKPLCPFCGILLQRSQPDFFLSISPV